MSAGGYKIQNHEGIHLNPDSFASEPMKEENIKMIYFDLSGSSPYIIICPNYRSKLERKKEETNERIKTNLTEWPWKWKKIWFHDPIPSTFKKNI